MPSLVQAAEMRTWTDSTGKFKIQGKMISNEGGKVTLERPDGTELEIELKKLSAADQKFIADLEKNGGDSPFKPKDDDPFKTKPGTAKTPDKTTETKSPPGKRLVADFSDVKIVPVVQPDKPWQFELPKLPEATGKGKSKVVALPKKSDFFEGAKSLVCSSNGKFAAVGYSLQRPGVDQPSTSRVVVCNLETGKQIGEGTQSGKFMPLAIHNDGKQVLMKRDDFGHGTQDRIELWNVATKSVSRGNQWVPYDDEKGNNRDVGWGSFIGDDRLATVSSEGKLVIWSLEDAKAVFTMDMQGGSKPAVSPDQKWLAFCTGKEIGLLDLVEGEVVALQSVPQVQWPVLAFSPGQTRLGMAAFDRLYVWNCENGELYREMPYQGLHVMGNITWPSEDHVLLGNRYLIDLENQVKLWDYQGGEFVQQSGGMTWFVVSDGHQKPGALLGAPLPPPAVKDALAKALSQPDFFVLKPGTVVKIDVSGVDAAGKDFVEKALTARLKDAGFEAGANGTIDLIAQTEVGQPRQQSYHTFGQIGSQTYTVRDYISKVKFSYKGQDVWQTQVGSVPFFIRLGQNETMDQFLQKSEKFNFDWFGKVDLPKLLQKPTQVANAAPGAPPAQVPTVGSTKLTTSGAR
jgi:WD40 repeat protein